MVVSQHDQAEPELVFDRDVSNHCLKSLSRRLHPHHRTIRCSPGQVRASPRPQRFTFGDTKKFQKKSWRQITFCRKRRFQHIWQQITETPSAAHPAFHPPRVTDLPKGWRCLRRASLTYEAFAMGDLCSATPNGICDQIIKLNTFVPWFVLAWAAYASLRQM